MDRALACANCHRPGPLYEVPVCGCDLCPVCAGGIVKTCPVCHAAVPMMMRPQFMDRREGDWSGWAFVAALFVFAGGLLWIAR